MLPKVTHYYQKRNSENFATYQTRTNIFKYSFFRCSVMEWNKLSSSTQNSVYPAFRNHLVKIIRPVSNPVYNIHYNVGLKLLTRLRLELSNLNEHRFNLNFRNCITPLISCSLNAVSTVHLFLHCHHFHNIRAKLLNSLVVIDMNLLKLSEEQLTKVLLYGFTQLNQNHNRNILSSSIEYLVESKPFENSLFEAGINFWFLCYCYLQNLSSFQILGINLIIL